MAAKLPVDTSAHITFILSTLSNIDGDVKIDWNQVAKDNNIEYARNAATKFKDTIKKYGYKFENNNVVKIGGGKEGSKGGSGGGFAAAAAAAAAPPATPKATKGLKAKKAISAAGSVRKNGNALVKQLGVKKRKLDADAPASGSASAAAVDVDAVPVKVERNGADNVNGDEDDSDGTEDDGEVVD